MTTASFAGVPPINANFSIHFGCICTCFGFYITELPAAIGNELLFDFQPSEMGENSPQRDEVPMHLSYNAFTEIAVVGVFSCVTHRHMLKSETNLISLECFLFLFLSFSFHSFLLFCPLLLGFFGEKSINPRGAGSIVLAEE